MAGHSKWANTKHRKSTKDNKKSKIFTKIIRELVYATKIGGNDPLYNPKLRVIINKALSYNMHKETINKTILGCNLEKNNTEKFIYEGYGPGSVALIIECISNNKNRTVSNIRYAFNKLGYHISKNQSVQYLFKKKGIISIQNCTLSKDNIIKRLMNLNLKINNINEEKEFFDIIVQWHNINKITQLLKNNGFKIKKFDIQMFPIIKKNINKNSKIQLLKLIKLLNEYEEVKKIYHDANILKFYKNK